MIYWKLLIVLAVTAALAVTGVMAYNRDRVNVKNLEWILHSEERSLGFFEKIEFQNWRHGMVRKTQANSRLSEVFIPCMNYERVNSKMGYAVPIEDCNLFLKGGER